MAEALAIARGIGYPVLVRPSYVLGGRAMEIVYDDASLERYMAPGRLGLARAAGAGRPVHRGRASRWTWTSSGDGRTYVIGGIMEHIEEAGVHSGDAAMVLPSLTLVHTVSRRDPPLHVCHGPRSCA